MMLQKTSFCFVLLLFVKGLYCQEPVLTIPTGHTGGIEHIAYSPDGKYMATASGNNDDKSVRIWETASGKIIQTIPFANAVQGLSFTKKGEGLLVHSVFIHLLDKKTWKTISTFDNLPAKYVSLCPEQQLIAFQPRIGFEQIDSIFIYQSNTGKETSRFFIGKDEVDEIRFSPDGKSIATFTFIPGDSETEEEEVSKIIMWDVATGQSRWEKTVARQLLNDMLFSHSSNFLIAANDTEVHLWEVISGEETGDMNESAIGRIKPLSFSSDDNRLLCASGYELHLYDISTSQWIKTFERHEGYISGAAFLKNEQIISSSFDSTFIVWDIGSGEIIKQIKAHAAGLNAVVTAPDTAVFAIADWNNAVSVWNSKNLKQVSALTGVNRSVNLIRFFPDSLHAAVADEKGTIKIINFHTGQQVRTLKGHSSLLNNFSISADGSRLVSYDYDSTLRVWNVLTGKQLYELRGEEYNFYNAGIHPDGNSFFTWESIGSKLKIRELETGNIQSTITLANESNIANVVNYSPDGKFLLLNNNGKLEYRDPQTGKLIKTLPGIANTIEYLRFSPDGKSVAALSNSEGIIWDITTGKPISKFQLSDNDPTITSARFSKSGQKIVCSFIEFSEKAPRGGIVRVFDVQTGKKEKEFYGAKTEKAWFTNSGQHIIALEQPFSIREWDMASDNGKMITGSNKTISTAEISPSGNLLVMADNETLLVHNLEKKTDMYRMALVNDDDWIVNDLFSRYDGSEAARKLLYFTCSNEIIELEQVKDQLWVPGLAERLMKGETVHAKKIAELDICGFSPVTEEKTATAGTRHFTITPGKGGLGNVQLLVNGIEVKTFAASQLKKKDNAYELIISKEELNEFLVAGQENTITLKALTADNAVTSRGLIIKDDKSKDKAAPPNLYAVMIGVSDYKGEELDLKYAAKDAKDIATALGHSARKLLNTDGKEHVYIYNLTTSRERDQLPEKNAIKKTLEEIGKKATANDILLIFFAGHGVMAAAGNDEEKKQFYFLTADASSLTSGSAIADAGISTTELTEWIQPQFIKAQKRILIFDACNSGQAIKDLVKIGGDEQSYLAARNDDKARQIKAIDKLNEKSGLYILSASASNQSAYEMGRYSQGLLTYSLLKAIKEQPDILEEGKLLNITRWFNAAEQTVSQLSRETGARQEPQIITNTNFNIGLVDEEVMAKIILPQEKPLFTGSNFQNSDEAIAYDDLELSKLVNSRLNAVSSRGSDNPIVYMTGTNSPEAFTLGGRYDASGNSITVRVNLIRNKKIEVRFELKGTTAGLEEIAGQIVKKAEEWVTAKK